MSSLGNVGNALGSGAPTMANSFFDVAKEPTSVTMHVVTSVPGAIAELIRNNVSIPTTGAPAGRVKSDGSGNINFYDMEDSGNFPYYINAPTAGETWSATVTGSVVVVTQLFASNRVAAYAFA